MYNMYNGKQGEQLLKGGGHIKVSSSVLVVNLFLVNKS